MIRASPEDLGSPEGLAVPLGMGALGDDFWVLDLSFLPPINRIKHPILGLLYLDLFGGFLKWGYPQIIYSNRIFMDFPL